MPAAGYCMYGSSCTLHFVLSTGNGVNGFALDPSLGGFILTHPNIKIPKKGRIYSVNEGNARNWNRPTIKFIEKCKFPRDGLPPKSLRYIGSMVADVHRTLLYGGVFLYPADKKSSNGTLRVLYEVFPMSFLTEQAGGQDLTPSKGFLIWFQKRSIKGHRCSSAAMMISKKLKHFMQRRKIKLETT